MDCPLRRPYALSKSHAFGLHLDPLMVRRILRSRFAYGHTEAPHKNDANRGPIKDLAGCSECHPIYRSLPHPITDETLNRIAGCPNINTPGTNRYPGSLDNGSRKPGPNRGACPHWNGI